MSLLLYSVLNNIFSMQKQLQRKLASVWEKAFNPKDEYIFRQMAIFLIT